MYYIFNPRLEKCMHAFSGSQCRNAQAKLGSTLLTLKSTSIPKP